MDLGATLRQAREARHLTPEQLSRTTRIPLWIVLAIEHDEWGSVPRGVFARGYIRAYAREVGIDGEPLVARFDAEHSPRPETPQQAQPTPRGPGDTAESTGGWPIIPAESLRMLSWAALVLVILVGYLAGRWTADWRNAAEARASAAAATAAGGPVSALGERLPQAVGTTAPASVRHRDAAAAPAAVNAEARGRAATAEDPIAIDIEVTRPCWVTASFDGTRFLYRTVRPGERVQARGRVLTLRTGDAGALRLALDGNPARALGSSGEVVTVRIARENYQSFLAMSNAE